MLKIKEARGVLSLRKGMFCLAIMELTYEQQLMEMSNITSICTKIGENEESCASDNCLECL